ncbi:MAG: carboxypeptidase regulatory-like domain-containing protein, partial [Candidatus Magnetomorum sp.]|nr:carboxypeptidase regulatory-like domain-containing protein [Candidatus Magnetomorum sp.]
TDASGVTDTQSFTITVANTNDTPAISSISDLTTNEDVMASSIAFAVTDVDTDALSITITTSDSAILSADAQHITINTSAGATYSVSAGSVTTDLTLILMPVENANGVVTVTVTVSDGQMSTSESFILDVQSINDLPVIADQSFSINENTQAGTSAYSIIASDIESSSLTYSITTIAPENHFSINESTGEIQVTGALNFENITEYTMTIRVSDGTDTASASLTATIVDVNEIPVISAVNSLAINEFTATSPIAVTVVDVDGNPLSLTVTSSSGTIVAIDAAHITLCGQTCVTGGTINLSASSLVQTVSLTVLPAKDGVATITITVADAELSASSSFVLTVNNVNIVPVISSISDTTINEDSSNQAISFTIVDADCEGRDVTLTVLTDNSNLLPTNAANVSIETSGLTHTGNADTVVTVNLYVTPLSNQFGATGITITLVDANNASVSEYFALTVTKLDEDAPELGTLSNDAINEDAVDYQVSTSIMDHDGGILSIAVQSSDTSILPTANIVLSGTNFTDPNMTTTAHENETLTLTITPLPDANGSVTITIIATDDQTLTGSSSFVLTVNPVDDVPVLAAIDAVTIDEDTSDYAISFTMVDADGGNLTVQAISGDTSLIANSGLVFSGTSTNQKVVAATSGNDSTVSLTLSTVENANGSTTITIIVTDSTGLTDVSIIDVTVNPVNDPPSISEIGDQNSYEDIPTVPIDLTISDIEAGELVIQVTTSDPTALPASCLTFTGAVSGGYTETVTVGEIKNLTLIILPPENINGTFTITLTVLDSEGLTDSTQFVLTVAPVNDMPIFVLGMPPVVDEDTPTQFLESWITGISAGAPDETEPLTFTMSTDNVEIFTSEPYVEMSGTTAQLVFTPAENEHGQALVTISLTDGYSTTAGRTFMITITSVNDSPSFTAGDNQVVVANIGNVQTVEKWATEIYLGPADELAVQSATFFVEAEYPALFAGGPVITADGTLQYTPIEKAYGISEIYVYLSDGGTGAYTSGIETFTIDISSINSPPSFTKGNDITVDEDSGLNRVTDWATAIDKGHVDESAQSIEFLITATNAGIFRVPPAIDYTSGSTGDLIFETEANANGTATLYITMKDNGGTVDGGSDTYTLQTMTITITAVNDAPSFVKGSNLTVKADNQQRTVSGWATGIKAGPGNEALQTYSFALTADDTSLFTTQPAIDINGNLTFKPSTTEGTTTVTVALQDNGGTANGGENVYTTTFAITTTAAAPPVISEIDDQNTAQDTPTAQIAFMVSDEDTAVNLLTLTGTSSDTGLVPDNYIIFGGTGDSRWVSVSPTAGNTGVAEITVWLNDGGKSVSESFALTVHARPSANIAIADTYTSTGTVPLSVQFTPTNMTNVITGWLWAFGDGYESIERCPVHTYVLSSEGDISQYTVTLTVSGPGGSSTVTETTYITVNASKYADFVATSRSGVFPLTVYFTDTSANIDGTPEWDFGDGSTDDSGASSISHVYTSPGEYTVTLIVGSYNEMKTSYVNVSGRTIAGRVTNNNSDGLGNVIVDVHSSKNFLKGSATTDADGYYTIVDLSSTSGLIVSAWPPYTMTTYLYQYYNAKETRDSATRVSTIGADQLNIDFQLSYAPTNAIQGQIIDNITGTPVALTSVVVEIYSALLDVYKSTTTDMEGNYTFTGLKSGTDYIVSVFDDRYDTEFFYHAVESNVTNRNIASTLTPSDPALTGIDIEIKLANTIAGQVVNDKGMQLSGIWVQARDVNDTYNTQSVRTNASGDYTLTGLDYVWHYIEILPTAYPYQAYSLATNRAAALPVTVNISNIDFVLKTGSIIRGRVTNNKNVMLSGVTVYARSSSKGVQSSTTTDIAGRYTLTNMPFAKDYIVYADSGDYPLQYYSLSGTSADARPVNLSYGSVSNINFVLNKGAVIHGNVRINDSTNAAGQGIMVNIYSDSTNTGGSVPTDTNGVFEIAGLNATATDYIISIWEPDYLPVFYNSTAENTSVYNMANAEGVAPAETYRNIVLKKGYSVCGKVSAANGSKVQSFTVELWSEVTNGYAVTQVTGNTLLSAPYCVHNVIAGTYETMIQAMGYATQTANVTVTGNRNDANFILALPSRAIGGTVNNIKSGRQVTISACSNTLVVDKCKSITVSGSGNIGYTIDGLKPASDYILELWSTSYPKQIYDGKLQLSNANKINVLTANRSDVNFTLPDVVPEISGTVTFPNEVVSVDSVAVQAFSDNGASGSTTVKYTGNKVVAYRITGLNNADYYVSVWSNKYKLQYFDDVFTKSQAAIVNTADVDPDNQVNFILTTGAQITGRILKSDGTPVAAGVYVEAQSLGKADAWSSCSTLADGTYLLGGLDARSDYIVSAKKTDIPIAYYHSTGSVQTRALAQSVSVLEGDQETIDITIQTGFSIKGTIRDSQSRGIFGVWVSASSATKGVGSGVYSAIDGTYTIKGLPAAGDYVVKAIPQASQSYVKQTKTNISAGATGVNFILKQGLKIAGVVLSEDTAQAISNAEIVLQSSSTGFYYKGGLADDGSFEIGGISSATDYVLTISPDASVSYIKKTVTVSITQDQLSMVIQLKKAVIIQGVVQLTSGTPVSNAWVTAFSAQAGNVSADAWTGTNGQFTISNIPDALDYVITVTHVSYPKKQVAVTIGQTLVVTLTTGGKISGQARTESGPLANVTVELWSESLPLYKSVQADLSGNFVFNSLPVTKNGFAVSDYKVTVKGASVGYPDKSKANLKTGVSVIITLERTLNNEINGTVRDLPGTLLPADANLSVTVYVYTTAFNYVKAVAVTGGTGKFKITGLTPDTDYVLVFEPKGGIGFDAYEFGTYRTAQNIAFQFAKGSWSGVE